MNSENAIENSTAAAARPKSARLAEIELGARPQQSKVNKGKNGKLKTMWLERDLVEMLYAAVHCTGTFDFEEARKEVNSVIPRSTFYDKLTDLREAFGYKSFKELQRDRQSPGFPEKFTMVNIARGDWAKYKIEGRPSVFSPEEEMALAALMNEFASIGVPITFEMLRSWGLRMAVTWDIPLQIEVNNFLTRGWFDSFIARHPFLQVRQATALDITRKCGAAYLKEYFEDVGKFMKDLDPRLLGNLDETMISSCMTHMKVIGTSMATVVHALGTETQRPHVSLMPVITASGDTLALLVIEATGKSKKAKKNPSNVTIPAVPDTAQDKFFFASTESGFIERGLFEYFMKNNVVPAINAHRAKHGLENQTFYLTLDGHASHHSTELDRFLLEHNIVLVFFPPHCSNIVQPLDRGVFHAFKAGSNRLLNEYHFLRFGMALSLPLRIACMIQAWNESVTPEIIRSSFYYAGLSPFNYEIALSALCGFSGPALFKVPEIFTLGECTIKNVYGVELPSKNMGFVLQMNSNIPEFSQILNSSLLSPDLAAAPPAAPPTAPPVAPPAVPPVATPAVTPVARPAGTSNLDVSLTAPLSSSVSLPVYSLIPSFSASSWLQPSSVSSISTPSPDSSLLAPFHSIANSSLSNFSADPAANNSNSNNNSVMIPGDLVLSTCYTQITNKKGKKLEKRWKYQLHASPKIYRKFTEIVDVISADLKLKILKMNSMSGYSSIQVGATNTVQFHAARWRTDAKTKVNKIKSKKEFLLKLNVLTSNSYKTIDRSMQLSGLRKAFNEMVTEADLETFLNAPAVQILQEPAFPSVGPVKKRSVTKEKTKKTNEKPKNSGVPRTTIRKPKKKQMDEDVREFHNLLRVCSVPVAVNDLALVDLTNPFSQVTPALLIASAETAPKKARRVRNTSTPCLAIAGDHETEQQPQSTVGTSSAPGIDTTIGSSAVSSLAACKKKAKSVKKQ